VTDLSGAAPEVTQEAVSAQVSDPRLPPAVLQRLTEADVAVAELSLRKPSLDEAYQSGPPVQVPSGAPGTLGGR
jgi:oleandomycin transport system ATP-binding protein